MDSSAIGDQIELILRSQTFAGKGQLRKLLGLLLKNIDSQSTLSPELVIRELWPDEIRTKRSTDVATEMNRLRHALKTYYEGEGASDPILICLPNRAATAGNGTHEKPWVTAHARAEAEDRALEDRPLESQADLLKVSPRNPSPRSTRKKVVLVATLATAVLIAGILAIRFLAMPDQPRVARLEGSTLVILNGDGKELWRKFFPAGVGPDWFYNEKVSWVGGTHVWFADLEGKGHTSVLFSYSQATAGLETHGTTLICYSDRGKEKWRWSPGRDLPELNGSPATYFTQSLRILKPTKQRPLRIVVASQQNPWWPSQIALLDSDGRTVSEYWHSGELTSMTVADLYGDGKEEIIAGGTANGYDHQATLVVLDPDHVFGASKEVRPEFQIHGMGDSQERLRLLFPRSDLNRALYQYNQAFGPTVEHGVLRLNVAECIYTLIIGCPVWYEFDKNFDLIAAYAGGDNFRGDHNKFFQTGNNAHSLSAEEQAAFQKVRCLVGCKSEFVHVGKLVP
jgi:hypothetical protein